MADRDYPLTADEEDRLAVLDALEILDSEPESEFDALVRAVSLALDTETATLSFVSRDRQWFKARLNLSPCETSREVSFCSHAILDPKHVMVVPDATEDARFAENELVTSTEGIRFYAGAPVVVDGQPVGSLCAISTTPRPDGLTADQVQLLRELAEVASRALMARVIRLKAERADHIRRIEDARVRIALETSQMSVWTWDVASGELTNFGQGHDESEIQSTTADAFEHIVLEEDLELMRKTIVTSLSAGDTYRSDFRLKDDPSRWNTVIGTVIDRDENRMPTTITGIQFDSTREKQEAEIAATQAQELRHRVNNLIGLVDALAGRTARETESLDDFTVLYRSRLQALARTQRMLLAADGSAGLEDIIEAVIEPFRKQDRSVIDLTMPPLKVDSQVTQVLTLVFHELTTNALKYGALRWPYGRVHITAMEEDGDLHVVWQEHANGEEGDMPLDDYAEIVSSGSGRSIVQRMVQAHGGHIDFEFGEAGLVATLRLPQ